MAGEMSRIWPVAWTTDQQEVVLEVPDESGKGSSDSEKTTLRQLLQELEDAGITDTTLNSHEIHAPHAAEVGQGKGSNNPFGCLISQLNLSQSHECMVLFPI